MGRKKTGEIKVYRETMDAVLKTHGMMWTKLSEAMGKDTSWLSKKFSYYGYAGFSEIEMIALTSLIGCTKDELIALPVSPEGKAKKRREAEEAEANAKPTEYTIDDVVSEAQNLAAEMAAGFIEVRKDKASAQKQDDLYELIRNTAKMIHTDIMTLVQAVRGDGQ